MFDIVTLEQDDKIVERGVNAVIDGEEGALPSPQGNYRYFVLAQDPLKQGNGGADRHIVVVVGHGSADSLSGHKTFKSYLGDCNDKIEWKQASSIYLVACSTSAADGKAFLHGSIAQEVANTFRNATVWASPTAVTATTLSGDWDKVPPSL